MVYGIIAQRRQQAGSGAQADLLQALLESRDEDGSGMTDTALRDELMTLMVGCWWQGGGTKMQMMCVLVWYEVPVCLVTVPVVIMRV